MKEDLTNQFFSVQQWRKAFEDADNQLQSNKVSNAGIEKGVLSNLSNN